MIERKPKFYFVLNGKHKGERHTLTALAKLAGVSWTTVHKWANHDLQTIKLREVNPNFQKAGRAGQMARSEPVVPEPEFCVPAKIFLSLPRVA